MGSLEHIQSLAKRMKSKGTSTYFQLLQVKIKLQRKNKKCSKVVCIKDVMEVNELQESK